MFFAVSYPNSISRAEQLPTIVTFLMVFLIQNAQNEDTRELHAKLDAVLQELRAGRGMVHDPELLELTPDEILEEVRAGEG